uniref:Uncharacterized protein n=1 Tax=Opuntia streptacantha TaxID=393608 RepID=A0A7C8ZQQ4_OPUST
MLNASLPSQEVLHVLEPPHYFHLHHQPLGCYPKCRFIGEPANFLSSYASVISALAAVASEAASKDPATSKELQLTSRPKGSKRLTLIMERQLTGLRTVMSISILKAPELEQMR